MVRSLIIILIAFTFSFSTNVGMVIVHDGTESVNVTSDSALEVAIIDSPFVSIKDTIFTRNVDTVFVNTVDTVFTRNVDTVVIKIQSADTVKIWDGVNLFATDGATNAIRTIAYEHHKVHSGRHFTFCAYDEDFDIADTLEFLITTADSTRWTHFEWDVTGALITEVQFFESTTHTADVTQTSYNNDRNSGTAALTVIATHNNDGVDGTLIDCASFGVSTGQGINTKSGGGEGRGGREWILKQNTKYLFMVASGADNSNIQIKFAWYEHVNLN